MEVGLGKIYVKEEVRRFIEKNFIYLFCKYLVFFCVVFLVSFCGIELLW